MFVILIFFPLQKQAKNALKLIKFLIILLKLLLIFSGVIESFGAFCF